MLEKLIAHHAMLTCQKGSSCVLCKRGASVASVFLFDTLCHFDSASSLNMATCNKWGTFGFFSPCIVNFKIFFGMFKLTIPKRSQRIARTLFLMDVWLNNHVSMVKMWFIIQLKQPFLNYLDLLRLFFFLSP